MKGYIEDEEFGKVHVELRRGMTSVRLGRMADGSLLLRAPLGFTVADLRAVIGRNREQMRRLPHPDVPTLAVGQVIECFHCRVIIGGDNPRPGYVSTRWDDDSTLHVEVHKGMDLADPGNVKFVSEMISKAMEYPAKCALLPFADKVARELGARPAGFVVGRGMRKLGHCTAGRVIQLSRNLMFLPRELVRYIICHELAHLTHMNHSPQFHALCDRYCGGKEKELERKLRQFAWPIMK